MAVRQAKMAYGAACSSPMRSAARIAASWPASPVSTSWKATASGCARGSGGA
jgi:hypothetical protein